MSAPAARWLGLDALRGLSIAAMILVNNPGRWGEAGQYAPLRHADWHGCTFTDLVFPTFLFCAGVAIVPALARRLENGAARAPLMGQIGKRVLWLVLLGLLLSSFPLVTFAEGRNLFAPLWDVRFPGVLQRIGVCYGIAAALFLYTSVRTQRWVTAGCLLLYWPLLVLGSQNIDEPGATLVAQIDRAVFGSHIWVSGVHDPEGLLSTLGALATCLLGLEAGHILRANPEPAARVAGLGRWAVGLLAIGALWSWLLPWNKALWTSSYAVWTAGIAMATLAGCVWAFELRGWRRVGTALQIYGVNALLVFVGSGLLGRILGRLWTVAGADGGDISAKEWFFRTVFLSGIELRAASLGFALLWVAAWFVALWWLYRRGIVWKV